MANEKDVAEKNLEAYNDVFADIVNGVLWGGKEVIKEDEENVQRICDAAKKYGGDEDKIYEAVCSSTMVVR